jgi:hypothetical protein
MTSGVSARAARWCPVARVWTIGAGELAAAAMQAVVR